MTRTRQGPGPAAGRWRNLTRNQRRGIELGLFVVWLLAAWYFGWLAAMVEGAKQGWQEGVNRP